jgi:Mrp family chromosome partitioning ATPase
MSYLVPTETDSAAEPEDNLVQFLEPKDASQLIHRIQRNARNSRKVVEFIGPSGGEGTSSIARDFALLMTRRDNLPVLLLDLDLPINGQVAWLAEHTLLLPLAIRIPLPHGTLTFHRVGTTTLIVSELVLNDDGVDPAKDPLVGSQALDKLRDAFSLIVTDAPPLSSSFEGVAFSVFADATIMVVEAEKTRAPVALDLSERLTDMGAHLVGFVFNKRKFYVPEYLYREL